MTSRPAAALPTAIVVLLALNCVVVGTFHIALLERRVAANAATALRLRLAAGSDAAAHAALTNAAWDTLPIGRHLSLGIRTTTDGDRVAVTLRRLAVTLFLLRAEASLPTPLTGTAARSILLRPPAIPAHIDPAAAGVSSRSLRVPGGGAVVAAEPPSCRTDALTVQPPDSSLLATHIRRIHDLASLNPGHSIRIIDGDFTLAGSMSGILIATGNVDVVPGSNVRGVVIAGGTLHIEQGARVTGAAHAADAIVAGVIEHDACAARSAIRAARLDLPTPAGARAWLPSF